MNPKKEFVNAIMSVLRLDQNIYTVASIEEIITRLDIKDYTKFIAYLGERSSDYEKPMQSIAKGVNEFYKLKLLPHKNKAERMIGAIDRANGNMKKLIEKQTQFTQEEKDSFQAQAKEDYGKQGEDRVKGRYSHICISEKYQRALVQYIENTKRSPKDIFFKELCFENNERVYPQEVLEIMIFCNSVEPTKEKIYEYYLRDKIIPSIEEKIIMDESGENLDINSAVKALMPKPQLYIF